MTLKIFCAYAAAILLANTAYIAAAASPTVFYMANVLAHVVLGAAVWIAALGLLVRERELRRTRSVQLAFVALTVAAAFAAELVRRGNLLEVRWVLITHVVAGAIATAALLPLAWRLAARGAGGARRFGLAYQFVAALLVVVPAAAVMWSRTYPNPDDRIVNPPTAPLSMHEEGAGDSSPFFPSSAQTNVGGTIPSDFFMDSERCSECHKDIYDQWQGSAHHFASFNNQFYRKSVEYMQSVVGTTPSKWCAGCHDHAVFFNGRFERPIIEQIDTPEAQAGLACTSCHAITRVDSSMGNGGFTIGYPPLHHLASSRQPVIRAVDRLLTYLDPEPHRRTFMKPFMRHVPQGAPRRAGQRLPLVPGLQRL
jgi:Cytochrome c554 and c-prime